MKVTKDTMTRRNSFLNKYFSFRRGLGVYCLMLMLQIQIPSSRAFQVKRHRPSRSKITHFHMGSGFDDTKKKSKASAQKKSNAAGDFAYQEMRAQLSAMKKQNIPSRDLDPTKRAELESYVRTVLSNCGDRSIPLSDIGKELLPRSRWRLVLSTAGAVLGDLPRDASVYLNILDEENLDYTLLFSKKTLGLKSITAKSKYTFDAGPVQPGLLTFVYDKITTDLLGLSNVGVGFFGLLKGRANYVESAYFDGSFWIERGLSPSGEQDYINVYMRDEDEVQNS